MQSFTCKFLSLQLEAIAVISLTSVNKIETDNIQKPNVKKNVCVKENHSLIKDVCKC